MSEDHVEHWKALAKRVGIERDQRKVRQSRIAKELDWSEWTQEEREIYASAFLFPVPAEPLVDGITINGVVLNMKRLARTARIIDGNGDVWMVLEHGRPEKA
jgi:hypothetical protein